MNSKMAFLKPVTALLMVCSAGGCDGSSDTSDAGSGADSTGGVGGSGGAAGSGGVAGSGGISGSGGGAGSGGVAGTSGSGGVAGSGTGGSGGIAGSGGTAGSGGGGAAGGILDSGSRDTMGGGADSGIRDAPRDITAPRMAVNLRTAGNYVILAKSGISTVPTSAITGDIAVSPVAATYITGFSLIVDATNAFATSNQVTGKVYAADYMLPTPGNLTTAVGDMELAFTDAAGRAPNTTELGAGNISGLTLAPGIYQWSTGLLIANDVTLNGNATDVWVFQIAQNLSMSASAKVVLTGGALPKNVFWQVSEGVDLGTMAHCEGVVLAQTAITLRTGASIKGRLLAQTAVVIDGSTIIAPAP